MTRRFSSALLMVQVLVAVLLTVEFAAAQSYKIEKVAEPAPQELAPAVRKTLNGEALRVVGPNGTLCEIWLRKVVPAKATATQELGIVYGQLAEGTLVAAVRFPSEAKDYRRQKIQPGVYTLRYVLVPVDGNHYIGVAPQRDFVVAVPAAADHSPESVTRGAALNLGRKTTGTSHPSVWSLSTAESPGTLPAIVHQEDGDLWVVEFRVQMQSGNSSPSTVPMALVVVGYSPEA